MDKSIRDILTTNLAELGLPTPTSVIQTILLSDRYFVGWKFRYDGGGYAVLRADSKTIEIFDEQGKLLKAVAVEAGKEAA